MHPDGTSHPPTTAAVARQRPSLGLLIASRHVRWYNCSHRRAAIIGPVQWRQLWQKDSRAPQKYIPPKTSENSACSICSPTSSSRRRSCIPHRRQPRKTKGPHRNIRRRKTAHLPHPERRKPPQIPEPAQRRLLLQARHTPVQNKRLQGKRRYMRRHPSTLTRNPQC